MQALQRIDRDDEAERLLMATTEVMASSLLAPAAFCRAVLAEPQPAGCGLEVGSKLGRMLMGAYSKKEVNDPKIFTYAVASVFADFPEAVGKQAIAAIIRKQKFPPAPAEVNEACQAIVAGIYRKRATAKRMLREHERREKEAAHMASVEADRADEDKRAAAEAMLAETKRKLAMGDADSRPDAGA